MAGGWRHRHQQRVRGGPLRQPRPAAGRGATRTGACLAGASVAHPCELARLLNAHLSALHAYAARCIVETRFRSTETNVGMRSISMKHGASVAWRWLGTGFLRLHGGVLVDRERLLGLLEHRSST